MDSVHHKSLGTAVQNLVSACSLQIAQQEIGLQLEVDKSIEAWASSPAMLNSLESALKQAVARAKLGSTIDIACFECDGIAVIEVAVDTDDDSLECTAPWRLGSTGISVLRAPQGGLVWQVRESAPQALRMVA